MCYISDLSIVDKIHDLRVFGLVVALTPTTTFNFFLLGNSGCFQHFYGRRSIGSYRFSINIRLFCAMASGKMNGPESGRCCQDNDVGMLYGMQVNHQTNILAVFGYIHRYPCRPLLMMLQGWLQIIF